MFRDILVFEIMIIEFVLVLFDMLIGDVVNMMVEVGVGVLLVFDSGGYLFGVFEDEYIIVEDVCLFEFIYV